MTTNVSSAAQNQVWATCTDARWWSEDGRHRAVLPHPPGYWYLWWLWAWSGYGSPQQVQEGGEDRWANIDESKWWKLYEKPIMFFTVETFPKEKAFFLLCLLPSSCLKIWEEKDFRMQCILYNFFSAGCCTWMVSAKLTFWLFLDDNIHCPSIVIPSKSMHIGQTDISLAVWGNALQDSVTKWIVVQPNLFLVPLLQNLCSVCHSAWGVNAVPAPLILLS